MRKNRLLLLMSCLSLVLIMVGGLLMTACSTPAPASPAPAAPGSPAPAPAAKPIEISFVTLLPKTQKNVEIQLSYFDLITKKSNGQIIFTYRGSEEAIPSAEQAAAVQRGVVDMAHVSADLTAPIVAAPAMIGAATIAASQDKEYGAYDFLVQLYEKPGLRYIMRSQGSPGTFFYIMVKKKVEKPQELAGMKMVGFGVWEGVANKLAMKPVNVTFSEYYTAMQQGVIEAVGSSASTFARIKLGEVAKLVIEPPFWSSTALTLMNLNKWNSIPKNLQDLIVTTAFEESPRIQKELDAESDKALKALLDTGVTSIKFTGADAAYYTEKLNSAVYDLWAQKSPTDGPKLYQLLQKKK